jgi:2-polyprenyl-3-methyl-5-hydroxy-6-metoxy-1,4-benzoquinol methylase
MPVPSPEIKMELTTCPLCVSSDWTPVEAGRDYEYWTSEKEFYCVLCSKCGHFFQNPRPARESARLIYPDNYSTFVRRHTRGRFNIIAALKKKVLLSRLEHVRTCFSDKAASVLEIGCGDGQLLLALKKQYPHLNCTGIDLHFAEEAGEMLSAAGIKVIEGAVEGIDLEPNSYTLVIMNQLIEHLWDLDAVIDKVYRCLSPGGMLSIETINVGGYDRKFFSDGTWGGYYFPRHLNYFGTESLRRFLQNKKFEILLQRSLVAPIGWIFNWHARLQKKYGKNCAVSRFFTDSNPFALAIFTVVDMCALAAGKCTSNQKVIARKVL